MTMKRYRITVEVRTNATRKLLNETAMQSAEELVTRLSKKTRMGAVVPRSDKPAELVWVATEIATEEDSERQSLDRALDGSLATVTAD